MWQAKEFKSRESMLKWIEKNNHRFQIVEIYINNGYAIEFKKFIRIY